MKETILITGGAGYLGSICTERFLQEGYKVIVLDNFMYGQFSLGHLASNKNLDIIKGDIRDNNVMASIIKKSDLIIPLAAIVGAPACNADPTGAQSINEAAPLNLFKNLSPSQRVIMPTTNSAYGTTPTGTVTDESSPLNPLSDYARQKLIVENALMQRGNSVSFRLATVFGMSPRMRLDLLVNDFTYRAVTDKFIVLFEAHFRRNYLHVRDVAEVFLFAVNHWDKLKGQIFNVGLSSANLTKLELCQKIKTQITDFYFTEAATSSDPDKRDYNISNAKIEATGWLAKYSLEDGIVELVKGYKMIKRHQFGNV